MGRIVSATAVGWGGLHTSTSTHPCIHLCTHTRSHACACARTHKDKQTHDKAPTCTDAQGEVSDTRWHTHAETNVNTGRALTTREALHDTKKTGLQNNAKRTRGAQPCYTHLKRKTERDQQHKSMEQLWLQLTEAATRWGVQQRERRKERGSLGVSFAAWRKKYRWRPRACKCRTLSDAPNSAKNVQTLCIARITSGCRRCRAARMAGPAGV